ncbi:hypothetical protein H9Q73_005547 [Fusarium xylarioides]|nr:hypothetical protein H9Q73_005547 [Fusarium xylarioides]
MAEASLRIMADNDGVPDKHVTMPEDPGDEVASQSDSDSSSIDEPGESDKPEPPPLHKKLLEIAEAEQPTKAALSAKFNTLLAGSLSEINAQDSTDATALHVAIEHSLEAEALTLIQNGADISKGDNHGKQPLYLACVRGYTKLVEILLGKKANIDAATNCGETPLTAACQFTHTKIVDILLNNEADTKISDEDGWLPLHWASVSGDDKIVKRLLDVDTSKIDAIETTKRWTPLNLAAFFGNEGAVSLLLGKNANLYIKDDADCTPLMTATRRQYAKIVRMILDHKDGWNEGYLEIRDYTNNTPLHVASKEGLHEIVSQLVGDGADCTAKDSQGMTPLHLASGGIEKDAGPSEAGTISSELSSSNDLEWKKEKSEPNPGTYLPIVNLLLQNNADPSIEDENHKIALHYASATGDKDRINLLLKNMKSEDLHWEDWKNSPVNSALHGIDPQSAMESLLAKSEVKKAAFWKEGGRMQVIKQIFKAAKPQAMLGLLSHEVTGYEEELPGESEHWDLIHWAAYERLPDELSELIDESETDENVYGLVHQALRMASKSIRPEDIESETACKSLVQVMWILITTSKRTTKNAESVKEASKLVQKHSSSDRYLQTILAGVKPGERLRLFQEHRSNMEGLSENTRPGIHKSGKIGALGKVKEKSHYEAEDMVRSVESHIMKSAESDKSQISKFLIMLVNLRDILRDPPFAQISRTHRDEMEYKRPVLESSHKSVIEKAEATVVAFFKGKDESGRIRRNRGIKEVIYGSGPTEVVGIAIKSLMDMAKKGSMRFDSAVYHRDNLELTWVHLPSTNMPYFTFSTHFESLGPHLDTDSRKLQEAHDHYDDLMKSYNGKDKQQHGSPTLDEWYYQFAQDNDDAKDDQKKRNKSQVANPQVTDWIITATSSPFKSSPDTLVDEILNLLSKQTEYGGSRAQPANAAELVPVIIDHCVGSYERRPIENKRISIGQTFSHYINRIGRGETALFDDFRAWSQEEHRPRKGKSKMNGHSLLQYIRKGFTKLIATTASSTSIVSIAEAKPTDGRTQSQVISDAIDKEKSLYGDIKDVRDELNILKSVAQFQQIVQKGLAGKDVDESRFSSTYVVKDLQELDSIAERIQSASDVANRQATEATRQGKTVMTFTFATVLFLPLSFLSSLFALDVASFQSAPAWAFYIIFFVSTGISAILGFGVFYWEDIRHAKHKLFGDTENLLEEGPKQTSSPSNSPGKEGGAEENTGGGDRSVNILVKGKNVKQVVMGVLRRPGRRADDIESTASLGR